MPIPFPSRCHEVTFATQALRGSELLSLVSLMIQTHVVPRVFREIWGLASELRFIHWSGFKKIWEKKSMKTLGTSIKNSYYLPFLWKNYGKMTHDTHDHHLQPPGVFIPSTKAAPHGLLGDANRVALAPRCSTQRWIRGPRQRPEGPELLHWGNSSSSDMAMRKHKEFCCWRFP